MVRRRELGRDLQLGCGVEALAGVGCLDVEFRIPEGIGDSVLTRLAVVIVSMSSLAAVCCSVSY